MAKEKLTNFDLEKLNMDGAKDAAKSAAKACAMSKATDKNASCESVMDVFRRLRKKPTTTIKPEKDGADTQRISFQIIKDIKRDNLRLCMGRGSKDAFGECMNGLKNMTDAVEDNGAVERISERLKDARQARSRREAGIEEVGSEFWQCLKAAKADGNDAEDIKNCTSQLVDNSGMVGLMDNIPTEEEFEKFKAKLGDRMKARRASKMVQDAARACNKTTRFACLDTVKDKLKEVGIEPRKFRGMKTLADIRGAAETWVGCMEANETEADIQKDPEAVCEALTNETLADLSGFKDAWQELKGRVMKLGRSLLDGEDTLIEKFPALDFEVVTDAQDCSDASLNKTKSKLLAVARTFPKLSNLTEEDPFPTCRMVFGKASYKVELPTKDMDETEIETLAVKATNDITDLADIPGGRRLTEAIVETYASQTSSEVPASETQQAAPQCVPFNMKLQNPTEGCTQCTSLPCAWVPCTDVAPPICTSATSR